MAESKPNSVKKAPVTSIFKQNTNIIHLEKLETVREGLMLTQESVDEEEDHRIANQLFHIGSPKVISTFAISSSDDSSSKYGAHFVTKR